MWKLLLIILAGLYTLSPYDLVPDLMVGTGWLDDLIIWVLVWRYLASQKQKFTNYRYFYQQTGNHSEKTERNNYRKQQRWGAADQTSYDTQPWDPYRTLEIDRSASAEEIKQAYRELANKYHPDKLEHLGDEFRILAENRFKEIQRAYQELSGK